MITYNFVILDVNKTITPFLNFLDENEFLEKLWEWCYEDDLWDYLDENNIRIEDMDDALSQFIEENIFHKWEDDDIDCFAFINTNDGIKEYQVDDMLIQFVKSKIKEHYENV